MNDALKLIGIIAIAWFLRIPLLFDWNAIKTWRGYDFATQSLDKASDYTKDRLQLQNYSDLSKQSLDSPKLDLEPIKKTCTDSLNFNARIKQSQIDAYLDLIASNQHTKSILLDTSSSSYRFCINKEGGFVFISDNNDNGVIAYLQNRKPTILKASAKSSKKEE